MAVFVLHRQQVDVAFFGDVELMALFTLPAFGGWGQGGLADWAVIHGQNRRDGQGRGSVGAGRGG